MLSVNLPKYRLIWIALCPIVLWLLYGSWPQIQSVSTQPLRRKLNQATEKYSEIPQHRAIILTLLSLGDSMPLKDLIEQLEANPVQYRPLQRFDASIQFCPLTKTAQPRFEGFYYALHSIDSRDFSKDLKHKLQYPLDYLQDVLQAIQRMPLTQQCNYLHQPCHNIVVIFSNSFPESGYYDADNIFLCSSAQAGTCLNSLLKETLSLKRKAAIQQTQNRLNFLKYILQNQQTYILNSTAIEWLDWALDYRPDCLYRVMDLFQSETFPFDYKLGSLIPILVILIYPLMTVLKRRFQQIKKMKAK